MTDFAPHTLTNNYSTSPYLAHASDSDINFHAFHAFDGNLSVPWAGDTAGVGWLGIDLGLGLAPFAPRNMSSNTAPSPYVASASSVYDATNTAAWHAFDGITTGFGTYWLGTGAGVDWLELDLGSGTTKILGVYDVQIMTLAFPGEAPKNWTMQGSNNGSTWTTVDTRTNETSWGPGEIRSYTAATQTTAYRYFRLNITANNGDPYTNVDELWLYEAGTSPGVGAYSQQLGSYAIKFDTSGTTNVNSAPKSWTVDGSNDGKTWTTVDTRTSETSWTSGQLRTYTCGSPSGTAFRFWRINITANNGNSTNTTIGELYLYTPVSVAATQPVIFTAT
jgi:hypothetical protein